MLYQHLEFHHTFTIVDPVNRLDKIMRWARVGHLPRRVRRLPRWSLSTYEHCSFWLQTKQFHVIIHTLPPSLPAPTHTSTFLQADTQSCSKCPNHHNLPCLTTCLSNMHGRGVWEFDNTRDAESFFNIFVLFHENPKETRVILARSCKQGIWYIWRWARNRTGNPFLRKRDLTH